MKKRETRPRTPTTPHREKPRRLAAAELAAASGGAKDRMGNFEIQD